MTHQEMKEEFLVMERNLLALAPFKKWLLDLRRQLNRKNILMQERKVQISKHFALLLKRPLHPGDEITRLFGFDLIETFCLESDYSFKE